MKVLSRVKHLLLISSFLVGSFSCLAQQVKLNFGAALAAEGYTHKGEIIQILVKGDPQKVRTALEKTGGTFIYSAGDIVSATLPAASINALADFDAVERIECAHPYSEIKPLSDTMLYHNRLITVHAGTPPLAQPYKGSGVVLGIIDTGIDIYHPDFQDSLGKSRIKFLWDQRLSDSVPPLPYAYGREWKNTDIDAGLAGSHIATAQSDYGHGTHVASVATGNGLAINKYEGAAPESDIVFVAHSGNRSNGLSDAVSYIYNKAVTLGKSCVINVSLGDYYGSHDGKDLQAQTIKNLIRAKPGRALAAAAGNAGTYAFHLGYNVSTDTLFTWFSGSSPYIAVYADTADFKNVQFAIGADQISPTYSLRGSNAFSNITPFLGVLGKDTIWNGSNQLGTMLTYGDLNSGVYSMEYAITADSSSYKWRFMTKGSGKFDAWTFSVYTANLADSLIYPALKKYRQPDFKSNMVSSFQCLDEVITVGNYTNRNAYIDYDTLPQLDTTRVPGDLFESSSKGPTRDGRIKPNICSPGDWTIGAMVSSLKNYNISVGNKYMMAPGGYHILDGGTSNASPSVAGIAALYFEADPIADWQLVMNAIQNCARQDTFTGLTLPDNNWGYGKADAFKILTGCITSNNNTYYSDFKDIIVFPNPAKSELVIASSGESFDGVEVLDQLGKAVYKSRVKNSELNLRVGWPAGIYFANIRRNGKTIAVRKIVISP